MATKKSKKQSDKALVLQVKKEMAQARWTQSAREQDRCADYSTSDQGKSV